MNTCNENHLPHVTSGRTEKPCGCRSEGLLQWAGLLPAYPADTEGYYRRRGQFVDQCVAILAAGGTLSIDTYILATLPRLLPLSKNNKYETWWSYIEPCINWLTTEGYKFIAALGHVRHPRLRYRGTYDLLMTRNERVAFMDLKCGSCPEITALQIAAYVLADGKRGARRIGLELTPNQCTPHYYTNWRDYPAFERIAIAYWREHDGTGNEIE